MTTLEVLQKKLAMLESIQNTKGMLFHIANQDMDQCVFYLEAESTFSREENEVYNQICQDAATKMLNTIKFNVRAEIHAIETGL